MVFVPLVEGERERERKLSGEYHTSPGEHSWRTLAVET